MDDTKNKFLQIKYRDYFRKSYNATFKASDFLTQSKFIWSQLRFIKKKILPKKIFNSSILEIGSGLGSLAKLLLKEKQVEDYKGIELDQEAVDFCNREISNKFFCLSLEKFSEVSSQKFDSIFALEVLEHLQDPCIGIRAIHKLLEQDGIFIGTSPYPYKKNVLADKTHKYCLHPANWEKLFRENGFSKVKIYPMSFFPLIWRASKYLNIRLPFYVPFPYFISTSLIVAYK